MAAAFVGVILGVIGSLGFMANFMQAQFAAQTASFHQQLAQFTPASSYASSGVCTDGTVATASSDPAHATASAPQHAPVMGGKGAETPAPTTPANPVSPSTPKPFVNQLITANIGNTGPRSTNTVEATNSYSSTVTNTNEVTVSNTNAQSATSGDVSASSNTTAGSQSSGDVENVNDTATSISISN